ncbi:hypothetical protein FRC02_005304 [Tulasnella sp. 418]|nr:hypothetical protein FRC02_005304 [Tulasnella sp. 418]
MLLYEPLTSHCGHTFCATCLQKTLDGHPKCPLCREDFNVSFKASIYASEMQLGELPINRVLLGILMQFFSKEYLSRKLLITRETEHLITSRFNTPIYVFAKLMLPGSKNLITFAQPRERAMLRSILSAQRATFGMMLPPRGMIPHASGIIHSYGTLVEIKSVQVFPEFRSVAEVEAISRFRVIESQLHDGYVVARVESIEDYPAPDLDILHPVEEASTPTSSDLSPGQGSASVAEEQAIETSRLVEPAGTSVTVAELRNSSPSDEMIALCREFVQQLRSGSAPFVVEHVNQNYGDEPTDPDALVWWVAALLPRDDHEKSRLLAIRSPVLRLRLICHWIRELHAKWWYQSGCVIS